MSGNFIPALSHLKDDGQATSSAGQQPDVVVKQEPEPLDLATLWICRDKKKAVTKLQGISFDIKALLKNGESCEYASVLMNDLQKLQPKILICIKGVEKMFSVTVAELDEKETVRLNEMADAVVNRSRICDLGQHGSGSKATLLKRRRKRRLQSATPRRSSTSTGGTWSLRPREGAEHQGTWSLRPREGCRAPHHTD